MMPALARFVDELRADPRFEPSANEIERVLRRVYDEGCENADAQTHGVAWLAKQKRPSEFTLRSFVIAYPGRLRAGPALSRRHAFPTGGRTSA
jgi:hypothetical protein